MPNRGPHKSQHTLQAHYLGRCLFTALSFLMFISQAHLTEAAGEAIKPAGLGTLDSVLVIGEKGKPIYAFKEKEPKVPASTLKILTALAALRRLGESFRFKTAFYLDPAEDLYVKGLGDPMLISEVIEEISGHLSKRVKRIKDIILDETFFENGIRVPGSERSTNPYDAPVGAICANFNTVFFKTGKNGRIISAEPQTPIVDFSLKRIKESGLTQGRHSFMNDSGEASLYFGHLLAHFLKLRGVPVTGKIITGTAPSSQPVFVHTSTLTLKEVLQKMMEFSNNFIANQVAITLGASIYGAPGTMEKAATALSSFGKDELQLTSLKVLEGSGISRENRISAYDMAKVLKAFEPYKTILKQRGDILYKSGTLRGIQARAGYILHGVKEPIRFTVFLEKSKRNIDDIMDEIALQTR